MKHMKRMKCAALALSACLLLCGAASAEAAYVGEAQGFAGPVTAYVTLNADGSIASVTAFGPNETVGKGSVAIEQLPERIVEANSTDVEAISGASVTSRALFEAVDKAIANKVEAEIPVRDVEIAFTPGVYTASAFAHNFDVTVEVTLSEHAIESVAITDDKSDIAMKNAVAAAIPERIVSQQSLNIDIVSGATETSSAVIAAVADCVAQASSEQVAGALRAKPRETVEAENLVLDADVAVVGGGGSGLTTAYALAEKGYSVVVLEAADILGGMTNVCGGGSLSIGSQLQRDAALYEDDAQISSLLAQEYETLFAASDYQAKASFIRAYTNALSEFVDFAAEAGIPYEAQSPIGVRLLNKGARFDEMLAKMIANNVTILTGTRGTDLITDETGAVRGVTGVNATGGTTTVNASAVVLATGGFLANEEMCKAYIPQYTDTWENWSGSSRYQGDGIRMAWAAGAAVGDFGVQPHDDQIPEAIHQLGISTHAPSAYSNAAYYPSLWINAAGVRFINEDVANGNAEKHGASTMHEGVYYTILDQAMIDKLENEGSPIGGWMSQKDMPIAGLQAQIDRVIEAGYAFCADSIEELAMQLGMDPETVASQVARYNELVKSGVDTDFGKAESYLDCTIETGPFYAFTNVVRVLAAYGGLDIDENMAVLDEQGVPVPGLFAAGLDAGSFMGNVYSVTTTTASFAICSGYMAGNGMDAFLKSR